MKKVLTIAGTDPTGGAGIQADLKTMTAHKVYGMSVITALVAQNTVGVYDILNVDEDFLGKQLDAVFTDIYPDSIKIGMVSEKNLILKISKKLKEYNAKNIVVDPVMVSTSGGRLLNQDAIDTLINELFPLASLITPNVLEAEVLANIKINNKEDMEKAAKIISLKGNFAILIKGGHAINDANDLLYYNNKFTWFHGERINNPNTHGTGCTLSSALACNLAYGKSLEESVSNSKKYISDCLRSNLDLGIGSGPLDHMIHIEEIIK